MKDSLETLPLIKTWKAPFESSFFYPEINKVLSEYKNELYIIFIPPSILDKTYWSLIAHEIGQRGYSGAKSKLSRLQGKTVSLKLVGKSYGRTVADVYHNRRKVRIC